MKRRNNGSPPPPKRAATLRVPQNPDANQGAADQRVQSSLQPAAARANQQQQATSRPTSGFANPPGGAPFGHSSQTGGFGAGPPSSADPFQQPGTQGGATGYHPTFQTATPAQPSSFVPPPPPAGNRRDPHRPHFVLPPPPPRAPLAGPPRASLPARHSFADASPAPPRSKVQALLHEALTPLRRRNEAERQAQAQAPAAEGATAAAAARGPAAPQVTAQGTARPAAQPEMRRRPDTHWRRYDALLWDPPMRSGRRPEPGPYVMVPASNQVGTQPVDQAAQTGAPPQGQVEASLPGQTRPPPQGHTGHVPYGQTVAPSRTQIEGPSQTMHPLTATKHNHALARNQTYIPEADFPTPWRGHGVQLRPRAEWEHDRAFLDVAIDLPPLRRASSPGPVVPLVPSAMPLFGKELLRLPQAAFLVQTYGGRVPLDTFAVPETRWNRDVQSQIELLRVISLEHLPHVLAAARRLDPSGAAVHALWAWIRNVKAGQFGEVKLRNLYTPARHHCVIDSHRWERHPFYARPFADEAVSARGLTAERPACAACGRRFNYRHLWWCRATAACGLIACDQCREYQDARYLRARVAGACRPPPGGGGGGGDYRQQQPPPRPGSSGGAHGRAAVADRLVGRSHADFFEGDGGAMADDEGGV